MKTRKPLQRGKPIARGVAPKRSKMTTKRKPKAKRDEKFAREFGSPERVAWVAALPCIACGRGPCENHHITGHAMGKRAHHTLVVPLCGAHHREWHTTGRHTFCGKYGIVAAVEAERVAKAWYELDTGTSWHLTTP
jgi:hypothetical protein